MNNKIKKLVISSLLVALSMALPYYMPTVQLGFWTGTVTAHVPVFLAMFISPYITILTGLGSALAFFLKLGPIVAVRALTHVLFFAGALYIYVKKDNILIIQYIVLMVILGFVHGASESVVVFLMSEKPPKEIFYSVFLFTYIHHCIDAAITWVVYTALKKATLMPLSSHDGNKSTSNS